MYRCLPLAFLLSLCLSMATPPVQSMPQSLNSFQTHPQPAIQETVVDFVTLNGNSTLNETAVAGGLDAAKQGTPQLTVIDVQSINASLDDARAGNSTLDTSHSNQSRNIFHRLANFVRPERHQQPSNDLKSMFYSLSRPIWMDFARNRLAAMFHPKPKIQTRSLHRSEATLISANSSLANSSAMFPKHSQQSLNAAGANGTGHADNLRTHINCTKGARLHLKQATTNTRNSSDLTGNATDSTYLMVTPERSSWNTSASMNDTTHRFHWPKPSSRVVRDAAVQLTDMLKHGKEDDMVETGDDLDLVDRLVERLHGILQSNSTILPNEIEAAMKMLPAILHGLDLPML